MVQAKRVLEQLAAPPRAVLDRLTSTLAGPSRGVLDGLTPRLGAAAAAGPSRAVLDRLTPRLGAAALWAMGLSCRLRPALREELQSTHPGGAPFRFEATFQFTTRDGASQVWARFHGGRLSAGAGRLPAALGRADVTVTLRDASYLRRFFSPSGDADLLGWMLDQHLTFDGNLIVLAKFGQLASAVALGNRPLPRPPGLRWPADGGGDWRVLPTRRPGEPCPDAAAAGARWLPDPALSDLTLDDFPRLKRQLHAHLHTRPRICDERARNWTAAALAERARRPAEPTPLRQARIFAHTLREKRAIVRDDDLLLGTTTAQPVGVQVFPELGGTAIWPELLTMQARELNPYEISDETIRALNQEVFPCWIDDNIREWTRSHFDNPECLKLDERWVLYFLWKNHAISHTIGDLPRVLARGLSAMAGDARERASAITGEAAGADADAAARRGFLQGVALCLEAVMDYAARLADEAEAVAARCGDPARTDELRGLAAVCRRVPAGPARTLQEALNSVWICFLALHQENMNAGLSIGRLDLWLQPYLEHDLRAALDDPDPARLDAAIRSAMELVGAFMLKCTDHLPLVADIGNRLFGGSSSDQVITLGGQRPDGGSAVCDMTYILLKTTEMLALRDPNMNARFAPGVDPDYYLRRLCEVNLITGATPSMHGDDAVVAALRRQGLPEQAARDWGATGCVEPTICGQHMGHTNCMMFNLVAPLEMALHDGVHPLLDEQVGPRTGDPCAMADFEQLVAAFETQLLHLIDRAVEANNLLGRAHQALHPTPFLSSLVQGTLEAGRDVVDGGARYNSSGVAVIGLADVVDSLSALRTLVYDSGRWSLSAVLAALSRDFDGDEALLAEMIHRVPRFGSGHPLPTAIARRLVDLIFEHLQGHDNYRGGRYLPGYWSMSNHVAFGLLSGALPSGRRRGKPFTPGLTPSALGADPLTAQIRQVAGLEAEKLPNNVAFNVKVTPGGRDDHARVVDRMAAYARTYFDLGGMQLQFNAVSSQTMRDAMEHPEQHRDLLVRISGYNAYFVECNRDMQLELIERTEHG